MTNQGTLDDLYLEWLYSHIGAVRNRNPSKSNWSLARQLYTKAFVWSVPNDDNRAEDGRALRDEFLFDRGIEDVDPMWMDLDCSILEMVIAISSRCSFESTGEVGDWFWKLLGNLELTGFTDTHFNKNSIAEVDHILERLNNRKYRKDGQGGLFPLIRPERDQTKVELWYQMSAYLLEGDYADLGT